MRQKVVIACGLVRSATTLLFDEPLTGLDPLGIRRMRDTIVARGAGRRRDPAVVAPAAPGRGGLHARDHHGPRAGRSPTARSPSSRRAPIWRRPGRTSSRSSCASPATTEMLSASLYIIVCTARNRLRVRLRRLREPRYLIGAIVGSAYLYFAVFNRGAGRRTASAAPAGELAGLAAAWQATGSSLAGLGGVRAGGVRLAPSRQERPARVLARRGRVPVSGAADAPAAAAPQDSALADRVAHRLRDRRGARRARLRRGAAAVRRGDLGLPAVALACTSPASR